MLVSKTGMDLQYKMPAGGTLHGSVALWNEHRFSNRYTNVKKYGRNFRKKALQNAAICRAIQ
ncbi:MAG: hypothetical protein JWR61_2277 [Ferruginibacter sp.]|nr:hypothetical protein [Ferruginibacter sp.]